MALIKEDSLFGRIALLNNFITKEQLEEALETQRTREHFCPVALILMEKGYISRGQFRDILETQKRKLPKPAINPQERKDDMIFGYLGFKNHYLDQEAIYQCLCLQSQMAKKGLLFRLSELLINKGHLSINHAEKILEEQDRLVISCQGCELQYNILGLQVNEFPCKRCGQKVKIDNNLLIKYKLEEIDSFNITLQSLAQKQTKPATVKKEKAAKPAGALQILSDGLTEFKSAAEQTKDEDSHTEEPDFTYGVSETREETDDWEESSEQEFIAAGLSGKERLKKHRDEEEWYKIGMELEDGTSDEDSIFDDGISDEEFIEISAISLARKRSKSS
ncbi:MAG: hypothetical protein HUU50_01455 [Candidatus Brocadiae bacterium]|nr:hypothetical protein [Candidatus Brocadiia bacterium]